MSVAHIHLTFGSGPFRPVFSSTSWSNTIYFVVHWHLLLIERHFKYWAVNPTKQWEQSQCLSHDRHLLHISISRIFSLQKTYWLTSDLARVLLMTQERAFGALFSKFTLSAFLCPSERKHGQRHSAGLTYIVAEDGIASVTKLKNIHISSRSSWT